MVKLSEMHISREEENATFVVLVYYVDDLLLIWVRERLSSVLKVWNDVDA